MRKLILGGALVLGVMSLAACESSDRSDAHVTDNKVVVDRDSVATEYEVTETVVEYDTTTRTKTVSGNEHRDDDHR